METIGASKASYEHERQNMLKLLNQYLLILAQMRVLFLLIIFLVIGITILIYPKEKQWKVQNSKPCLLHLGDPSKRLIFTQMIRCC